MQFDDGDVVFQYDSMTWINRIKATISKSTARVLGS